MTIKYSRKLLNDVAGGKSWRAALEDMVLSLYEGGTPPTNPEDARTGTKLALYTLSGAAIGTTYRGTARIYKLVPANFTEGNTIIVNVTVDGVGPTSYTYTILAADDSVIKVAVKIARMLDDIPQIQAVPEGDAGNVWAQCRIAGLALTLADGGGTTACATTAKQAAARANTLQLSAPAVGVLSKPVADTWQCSSNLASGTAGYWVLHLPDDPLTADAGYIYRRVQGTIALVGGDGTIDPATITAAAVSTIPTFSITLPTS